MVCDLCPSAEAARPSGIGDRIRDALARLDPKFAYAAGFDKAFANIQGSSGKRSPNGPVPEAALLVRPEVASARLRPAAPTSNRDESNTARRRRWSRFTDRSGADREPATATVFFGSVEIDAVRPVKAFEAILNAHGRLLVLTLRLPR